MLRFLETNEVEPLGADEKRRVDVRVVAAAQDDLSRAVGAGQLRRDLFQRLAGVVLELPLLATRVEDIVPLAEHFAASQEQCLGPGADLVLLNHSWPGNVRELRLTIERAGLMAGNGSLPASAIAEAIALGTPTAHEAFAPAQSPRQPETPDEMIAVLNSFGWDPLRTAAALGIGRTSLFKRLRDLGISLRATKRGWSTAVHRLNS
jgi:DNA-binding NtrC family response regulator